QGPSRRRHRHRPAGRDLLAAARGGGRPPGPAAPGRPHPDHRRRHRRLRPRRLRDPPARPRPEGMTQCPMPMACSSTVPGGRAPAISDRADDLATIETSDMGKPITVSRKVDLRSAPEAVEYFAGMAGKIEGRTVPVPGRFLNYTVREPYGVVAGIIPWNYPL